MRRRPPFPLIVLLLLLAGTATPAAAEPADSSVPGTPSASPSTHSPSPSPATSSPATPSPATSSPTTSSPTTSSPTTSSPSPRSTTPSAVTLAIAALGSPVPGRFYEDIGWYAYSGELNVPLAGQVVEVWSLGPDQTWQRVAAGSSDASGHWTAQRPVTTAGTQHFRATLGGSPVDPGAHASADLAVITSEASTTLNPPPTEMDAMATLTLTGQVIPARPGVPIRLQVRVGSDPTYRTRATTTTRADGRYRVRLTYGVGLLQRFGVRALYLAQNRHRYEISPSGPLTRIKVLHAVVTPTTAAEVAATYRAGCPVGPSRLATVMLNYYGFDRRMHRGMIIVRRDLTPEIIRSFSAALDAWYPLRRMDNPNVYGGNDPVQMAADNTSGFNCRKVVGNPYAQSPHSYGIAIDVNTVENPYRDASGRWWPSNGTVYIDRLPLRRGMLGLQSRLTVQLRHEGYFWGGLWSPGRDYQHFQYQ